MPFLSGAPPPKKSPRSAPERGGFMIEVTNPGSPPELIEPVNKLFGVGVVSYADVLRGLSCIPACMTNQKHLQGRLGWRREKLLSR